MRCSLDINGGLKTGHSVAQKPATLDWARGMQREAEALAVHLKDVDVVGQPVEKGAGQQLCSEGLGPFVERQVVGDERGTALIALGDHLEQQISAGLGQGHEAQFVDDEQFDGDHLLPDPEQAAFVAGIHQIADQSRASV